MKHWPWYLCLATLAPAQTGYLTYPTGITPSGVTAADLNGDGKPDLAIANTGSNSLTILLNNAAGGFTPLAPYVFAQANFAFATTAPRAIIAADLNGDHKTDLVVTSPLSQSPDTGLAVLLGNGDGTFQPPLPVSGCPQVTAAQVADLNGDGIPDLALTCLTSGSLIPTGAYLLTLPANGDGTFGTGAELSLGFTPWAVLTVGDFNNDGKPDLAVATGGGLAVLLNDGKANFTALATSNEPWNFAPGIAAGDFNGDGILDLAVTGQAFGNLANGTVTILLGSGDGTFRSAPVLQTTGFGQIVAMDLNGDGHVDLVEGLSSLVFFAGRGDGTFEQGFPFGISGGAGFFALADFTSTGVMGFAVTNDFETPDQVQIAGTTVILPRAAWPSLTLANTSAAGFGLGPLAPGSIASAFGTNLATQTAQSAGPPPVSLAGVSVSVTDSAGVARQAGIFYISSTQVNYLIPPDTASGLATVSIMANSNVTATGQMQIVPVAPALFTMNSDNLAAANVVKVSQDGDQTYESIYQTDQNGNITALPIDLGSETDTVYLILYGTGIRNLRNPNEVTATLGGAFSTPVAYAGPQPSFQGLDQVNLQLPRSLASSSPGTIVAQLTVDGQPSNQVTLLIQ
jgi:uncharacterized protein (TIGR03437 family)